MVNTQIHKRYVQLFDKVGKMFSLNIEPCSFFFAEFMIQLMRMSNGLTKLLKTDKILGYDTQKKNLFVTTKKSTQYYSFRH